MYHDILLSLIGFTGNFIIEASETFCVDKKLNLCSYAEEQQINQIVNLGWYFVRLHQFVDSNQLQWKIKKNIHDREQSYLIAVGLGIADLLREYSEDVMYLEQVILTESNKPLSYFHHHLQKYIIVLPPLWQIIQEIQSKCLRGCQILDYLANIQSGMAVLNDLLQRLMYHVHVVFLKQCLSWTLYGELDDDGEEFFIQRRHDRQLMTAKSLTANIFEKLSNFNDRLNSQYIRDLSSDTFDWTKSYYLRMELLPETHISLLLASKILFCGKAVKLLKIATSNSQLSTLGLSNDLDSSSYIELYRFFSGDKLFGSSFLLPKASRSDPSFNSHCMNAIMDNYSSTDLNRFHAQYQYLITNNLESSFNEKLESLMSDIQNVISSRLWQWLRDDLQFISFLQALRNCYLLGRGEFFQYLLDSILEHIYNSNPSINSKNDSDIANTVLQELLGKVMKDLSFDDNSLFNIHVGSSKFSFRTQHPKFSSLLNLPMNRQSSLQPNEINFNGLARLDDKSNSLVVCAPYDDKVDSDDMYDHICDIIDECVKSPNKPIESLFQYGSINLVDKKYISKGFSSRMSISINWDNVLNNYSSFKSIIKQANEFHRRPYAEIKSHLALSKSFATIGGISLLLHNDYNNINQSAGSGPLGIDNIPGAVAMGISFHAQYDTASDNCFLQMKLYLSRTYASVHIDENTSSVNDKKRMINSQGYEYEILAFKSYDVQIDLESKKVILKYGNQSIDGDKPIDFLVEYSRILTTASASATFSSPIHGSASTVSSMVYVLRIRMQQEQSVSFNTWDIESQVDLSKAIKLQNGQSFVSIFGSTLMHVDSSHPNSSPMLTFIVSNLEYDSKGILSSYPVASTITTSRFPDTTVALESTINFYRIWMNLKLDLAYPKLFNVVLDQEAQNSYQRIFTMLMKIKLIGNSLDKLWLTGKSTIRLINDRLFCHLRHSMHFFINNLLYYLQVDVIDSEYSDLIAEIQDTNDLQAVLKHHRNYLTNLSRMSFIDNVSIQDSLDRIFHTCLRFLALCQLLQKQQSQLNQSDNTSPIVVPQQEFEFIKNDFYSQLSYLFQIVSMIENKGFLFRLDFNGYLSQILQESSKDSR